MATKDIPDDNALPDALDSESPTAATARKQARPAPEAQHSAEANEVEEDEPTTRGRPRGGVVDA